MSQTTPAATPMPDGERPEQLKTTIDEVLSITPETTREPIGQAIDALVNEIMGGVVTIDKSVSRTITSAITALDERMSRQLAAVMHDPDFQKLEGSWRGLHHLVMSSETGTGLKIRMLNVTKRELYKDLEKAVDFDQSTLFRKLYEDEFGMPGGEPFGALIGDYEFDHGPEDVDMLQRIAGVSATAFCPFLTAASPNLFGLSSFTELGRIRDLAKGFDTPEYAAWKSFRESLDAAFVTMTMPRTLARLPYGKNTKSVDEFDFEEGELDASRKSRPMSHDEYCWMNTAYVLGTRLTDAFAKHGWCTAIRGKENGGLVEGLPGHVFKTDDGDIDLKCPTEIAITERRENELSKLGFLPLSHFKNTDYAVFFGGQSMQKPKKYEGKDGPAATANAALAARLPYVMATARITHYLKVMAREKIGSFMEVKECEKWLNDWLANYVLADPNPSPEQKAKFPLAAAEVSVEPVPGAPGSYRAIAWLRPWLQMEELTTSMRVVAEIPKKKG